MTMGKTQPAHKNSVRKCVQVGLVFNCVSTLNVHGLYLFNDVCEAKYILVARCRYHSGYSSPYVVRVTVRGPPAGQAFTILSRD